MMPHTDERKRFLEKSSRTTNCTVSKASASLNRLAAVAAGLLVDRLHTDRRALSLFSILKDCNGRALQAGRVCLLALLYHKIPSLFSAFTNYSFTSIVSLKCRKLRYNMEGTPIPA